MRGSSSPPTCAASGSACPSTSRRPRSGRGGCSSTSSAWRRPTWTGTWSGPRSSAMAVPPASGRRRVSASSGSRRTRASPPCCSPASWMPRSTMSPSATSSTGAASTWSTIRGCAACSLTPWRRGCATTARPACSRSTTGWSCGGRSWSGTRGWRSTSTRRSWPPRSRRWPARGSWSTCTSAWGCCRRKPSRRSPPIPTLTAYRPTATCWRRSRATPTSRASRRGWWRWRRCSRRARWTSSRSADRLDRALRDAIDAGMGEERGVEAAQVRGGEECLPLRADGLEHEALLARVELGEDVVEQQQGALAGLRAHELDLCELEGDHAQPLLATGAVSALGDVVQQEVEVVAVRSHQGDAQREFALAVGQETRLEALGQALGLGGDAGGVAVSRHARGLQCIEGGAVGDDQPVAPAAQGAVEVGQPGVQGREQAQPLSHEIGAAGHEFGIPRLQQCEGLAAVPHLPQQVVALQQHLVVALQRTEVARIDLREGYVEVAPPPGGGTGD